MSENICAGEICCMKPIVNERSKRSTLLSAYFKFWMIEIVSQMIYHLTDHNR